MLTPNERDMGAEIIIEAPKSSKFKGLQFVGGFFNGTGLTIPAINISDIDSRKVFIGRLSYYSGINHDAIKYGAGVSHYIGFERMANNYLYNSIKNDSTGQPYFALADSNSRSIRGAYAKRIYYGVEGFFSIKSVIGLTTLRGEYVFGQQPGSASDSKSPQAQTTGATYLRNFDGMYAYFIQRIGKTGHEFVVKYEWYDPNTKLATEQVNAAKGFSAADIKYTALGLGYNWIINDNYKLMFHYNMVTNEKAKVTGFSRDLPDNIFTARAQVRF
jgi:hypothetical protein